MNFSRMHLNPQRRGTRALLASPHEMHKAVLSCFPPDADNEAPGRILWRVDSSAPKVALYIVSPAVPSFEHLQETAGWSEQKSWESADYGPLLRKLDHGQRFRFRLTANPVHTVTDAGIKRRLAHVTAEHQLRWLHERQGMMGVAFPPLGTGSEVEGELAARITGRERVHFRRRERRVTLVRATYEGLIDVQDPEKLRAVLTEGIGKAKGYGCGLLTLSAAGATSW